ncbi:inorganic phosphate transporter, partial [Tamlana sp. PT2-4]|nr:inorganic phosphate transporter [Tamlana laminarinivorans]
VNFIGVPIAALDAHTNFSGSGVLPSEFRMSSLSEAVPAQPILLLIAGLIMVLTLWFSSKAKAVVKTSVDLSRQDSGEERFEPNSLSRGIVRGSIAL